MYDWQKLAPVIALFTTVVVLLAITQIGLNQANVGSAGTVTWYDNNTQIDQQPGGNFSDGTGITASIISDDANDRVNITSNLVDSYALPQTCAIGEVTGWSGDGWECVIGGITFTGDQGSLIVGNSTGDWGTFPISPTTGDVLRGDSVDVNWFNPLEALAFKRNYQWGYQAAALTSTSDLGSSGLILSSTQTGSNVQGSFSEDVGASLVFNTGAVSNARAGTWTNLMSLDDVSPLMISQFRAPSGTPIRFFAGLSEGTALDVVTGDQGSTPQLGIRFDVGDPGWVFVTSNGTSISTADSGVTFVISEVKYVAVDILNSTQEGTVRLFDSDFVLEAEHIFTTNLPIWNPGGGQFTTLRLSHGLRTEQASARTFDYFQSWIFNRGG